MSITKGANWETLSPREEPKDLPSALAELQQLRETLGTMTRNWMMQCQRSQNLFDEMEKMKQEMQATYDELERLQTQLISSQESERSKEETLRAAASRMKTGLGSRGVKKFKQTLENVYSGAEK